MKLFTNGCSVTYGLSDPGECLTPRIAQITRPLTWTEHLNKQLSGDTSATNYAACSGSNERIARTTLNFFLDKLHRGENISDYIAVIQFTVPKRRDVHIEERDEWIQLVPDAAISNERTLSEEDKNALQLYFLYATNRSDMFETLKHIIVLGDFFKKHNIKYLFAGMTGLIYNEYRNYAEFDSIHNYIVKEYNWLNGNPSQCGFRSILNYRQIGEEDNPDAATHKLIATSVFNNLASIYPELKTT